MDEAADILQEVPVVSACRTCGCGCGGGGGAERVWLWGPVCAGGLCLCVRLWAGGGGYKYQPKLNRMQKSEEGGWGGLLVGACGGGGGGGRRGATASGRGVAPQQWPVKRRRWDSQAAGGGWRGTGDGRRHHKNTCGPVMSSCTLRGRRLRREEAQHCRQCRRRPRARLAAGIRGCKYQPGPSQTKPK